MAKNNNMSAEEARIRSLIHIRTGDNEALEPIPNQMMVCGLYPSIPGEDMNSQVFRDKISQWPEVKKLVVKHGLMIPPEFLLVPYGSQTEFGLRFVAEMIMNKDNEEIFGVLDTPEHPVGYVINLKNIISSAKLSLRSGGIFITDLKFVADTSAGMTAEECLWRKMVVPKPIVFGVTNKKLGIVSDCDIKGFYFGPRPSQAHMAKLRGETSNIKHGGNTRT